jgi:hypothetical protein
VLIVALMGVVFQVGAVTVGTDVIVSVAVRAGTWITDLYILNPGPETTEVTMYWLVRNRANPYPMSLDLSIGGGETLVLDDVIMASFGLDNVGGAVRVVADDPVVVNTRIYNLQQGVTFGQGFEGVPRSAAATAGDTVHIVGLTDNDDFRTNIVLIDASGEGSTVQLSLHDPAGNELTSGTYRLGAFEPVLDPVSELDGSVPFDDGTLVATVTDGSAIVVASKVDNDPLTGDPTTLAGWTDPCCAEDGTYQLTIFDSEGYATGGRLTVQDRQVTNIDGIYTNWDKGGLAQDCTLTFRWGSPEVGAHSLDDFAQGVTFTRTYDANSEITWTVTFTVHDNQSIEGSIDAVGEGFSGPVAGCNGIFPTLPLLGGKSGPTIPGS